MAAHGRFIPKHPEKYVGDVNKIMFRSSWELSVLKWLDSTSSVLRYGSEELVIPYLSPVDSRVHRYFPDFFIEYRDKDGNVQKEIVEVKPLHESDEAHAKGERAQQALLVNKAKWKAAAIWCEQNGMRFRVITERSIFHQVEKKPRKKKDADPGTLSLYS